MTDLRENAGEAHDVLAAALVGLTEHGIPADVQELLVCGDPARGIPPGALAKVLQHARGAVWAKAAAALYAQAAVMEGPHIVQNATSKNMATATRDCAAVLRGLAEKENRQC